MTMTEQSKQARQGDNMRILAGLILLAGVATCAPHSVQMEREAVAQSEPKTSAHNERFSDYSSTSAFRDPATGCEYLIPHKGGITPRLNADGKQICVPNADAQPTQ